jgi:hypothetical protein
MAKLAGTRIPCVGHIGYFQRLLAGAAVIRNRASRFAGISRKRIAGRFQGIFGVFRLRSSSEKAIFADPIRNPRSLYEIRNRSYLDIHSSIR